jgi:hypothetical protein
VLSLKRFGEYISERLRKDWDVVIAITGEEGVGKSTIMIELGKLIDKKFSLKRNVSFIPKANELAKQFQDIPEYSFLGVDEAIRALHKFDWMTNVQQTLLKLYATERYQHKCFGKDTKILMFDGSTRNVQDIKKGDLIMGIDSTSREVLKTVSGTSKLHKIIPYKGESFITNENHTLSLKYYNHSKTKIYNISVKEFVHKSKDFKEKARLYRVNINFPYKSVPFDPYFLGVWLGDGLSAGPRIASQDFEIIEYLREYASSNGLSLKQHSHKKGLCQTWALSKCTNNRRIKNKVMSDLKNLNLINNKHIPDIYKINSESIRLQVLAGLLDTDGNLSFNHYRIPTKFIQLREDILFLARSLGFSAHYDTVIIKNKPYYIITIAGETWRIPLRIKRKIAPIYKRQRNQLRSGIKRIEDIGEGEYFGFEVDKDKLFCMGDFTVSHNCTTVVLPRFRDLTENFRNHRVKIRIHILKRGIGVVHLRDSNEYVKDPWHMDENLQVTERTLQRKKTIGVSPDDLLRSERKTKTYWFDFTFPDLDPKVKEEYQALRLESRNRVDYDEQFRHDKRLDQARDTVRRWKMTTYNLLKEKGAIKNMEEMKKLYHETGNNIWMQTKQYREKKGLPPLAETVRDEIMIPGEDFTLPELEQTTQNQVSLPNSNITESVIPTRKDRKRADGSKKQFA